LQALAVQMKRVCKTKRSFYARVLTCGIFVQWSLPTARMHQPFVQRTYIFAQNCIDKWKQLARPGDNIAVVWHVFYRSPLAMLRPRTRLLELKARLKTQRTIVGQSTHKSIARQWLKKKDSQSRRV